MTMKTLLKQPVNNSFKFKLPFTLCHIREFSNNTLVHHRAFSNKSNSNANTDRPGSSGPQWPNWLTFVVLIPWLYLLWDLDNKLLRHQWYTTKKIVSSRIPPVDENALVKRNSLTDALAPLVGKYYIVVGPRGCGKTTAVKQAHSGKTGVIRIRVDKATVNVYELVAESFGVKCPHYNFNNADDLVKMFKAASASMGNGWIPTIIAEVDRGADVGTVENVSKALKVIAADEKAAHVILVLSDANAAFSLPADYKRQEFVWVDDFSLEEANRFLDKAAFLVNDLIKRREVFEQIGTRPATLSDLVNHGIVNSNLGEANADDYVSKVIRAAKTTLVKLLKLQSYALNPEKTVNFTAIHQALLKSPSGVSADSFDGATGTPEEACVHLRQFHAFVYHLPSEQYRYADKEFEHAAKLL